MKPLRIATSVFASLFMIFLATGCATNDSATVSPARETTLAQAGFQNVTITSPRESELLAKLPANQFSRIRRQNDIWYVLPNAANHTAMVGRRPAYDTYMRMTEVQHLRPLGISAAPVAVWRGSGGTVWGERATATRIPARPTS